MTETAIQKQDNAKKIRLFTKIIGWAFILALIIVSVHAEINHIGIDMPIKYIGIITSFLFLLVLIIGIVKRDNKLIVFASRIFLGLVFIFSGYVKVVDPLGSEYKFVDYFEAFGTDFMVPLALPLAMIMSAVEFVLGVALFFNVLPRLSAWGVTLFMIVFTPLTLYLALANPVSDCGCFGDALILTNWQTFWKNIFIDIFVVILFVNRKKLTSHLHSLVQWILMLIFFGATILFQVFTVQHLPIIDFRPYRINANIPEKMKIPESAPQPKYETTLYYEKDGVTKQFTMENLPDSTWKWVRTENELIDAGYVPPIHDFSIVTVRDNEYKGYPANTDITTEVLENPDYNFLMVAYDISEADTVGLKFGNELAEFCEQKGLHLYCLTASSSEEIKQVKQKHGFTFNCYTTDEITLKTIVRASPGFVLLKNGTIINKWHHNDMPSILDIQEKYLKNKPVTE